MSRRLWQPSHGLTLTSLPSVPKISGTIAYWNEHGRIGTHAEMIAFNIDKKLVEPNPDRDEARPLAQAKALKGAMLLAAALTFTRKNSILLPDQPVDPARAAQAIEPKELWDWDARDIQTLLGRALFDEATYGRVRFHHRSVREYLTARWLLHLLKSGKPRRAVEGLLFAQRYGLDVSYHQCGQWLPGWHYGMIGCVTAYLPSHLKSSLNTVIPLACQSIYGRSSYGSLPV